MDVTTGNIFYVGALTGSDNFNGKSSKRPFATINEAIAHCFDNKGDVILLMPGHYEDLTNNSVSGAIDIDVAGVRVIGIGNGTDIPRFDFNHANSSFVITANDIHIQNVNFQAAINGISAGLLLRNADGVSVIGCKFTVETTTTDHFTNSIYIDSSDHILIEDCYFDMGLGGATYGIYLHTELSDIRIYNNTIKGDYSTANIGSENIYSLEVDIRNNLLINGSPGNIGTVGVISLFLDTTGYIVNNDFFCNVASVVLMTEGFSPLDTMFYSRNFANEDVGAAAGAILRTDAVSVTAMADD